MLRSSLASEQASGGTDFELAAGACLTIRPGDVHRVEALEDSVILEVSTPHLDDVIRLEDRYGR
jgi:mannose-6-phosphate isomerase